MSDELRGSTKALELIGKFQKTGTLSAKEVEIIVAYNFKFAIYFSFSHYQNFALQRTDVKLFDSNLLHYSSLRIFEL